MCINIASESTNKFRKFIFNHQLMKVHIIQKVLDNQCFIWYFNLKSFLFKHSWKANINYLIST